MPNETSKRPATKSATLGERLNDRFTDAADWVSSGMGTPVI